MKKFRDWLGNKTFSKQPHPSGRLSEKVELTQTRYPLNDGRVMTLRKADSNDIGDILTIQKKCYNGTTPWNRRALHREIAYNKNAVYLLLHENDEPAAFIGAWFARKEAHVTNVATVPDYERKGLATFLISQIIDIAAENDCDILTLEVRVSNKKAQSLYRTLGFIDGLIKQNYYTSDGEDALDMILYLYSKEENNENDKSG